MTSSGPAIDEGGDRFASVGVHLMMAAAPGSRLGTEPNLEGRTATVSTQLPAMGGVAVAGVRRYPHEEPVGKAAGEEGSRPSSSLRSDPPQRKDTENLIAEIFGEECGAEECGAESSTSHAGGSPGGTRSLGILQQHSRISQAEEETPPPPPPPPPHGNARHEIQRRMEELREELRDGQSQWEVHEQIGKGGFGVVYKVGGQCRGGSVRILGDCGSEP